MTRSPKHAYLIHIFETGTGRGQGSYGFVTDLVPIFKSCSFNEQYQKSYDETNSSIVHLNITQN